MMAASRTGSRRGLVWAIAGGAVLITAVIAIVASGIFAQSPIVAPSDPRTPSTAPTSDASDGPTEAVVDAAVAAKGWVPEPVTADPDTYIRAALAAASTFDTQKSGRDEWLAYLDSWFTPDTRYTSQEDRMADMLASQLELRQAVVLPEPEWDSLANEAGRVAGSVSRDITYDDVPNDESGDMRIGTADVLLTFTRSDGSGDESSYDEKVRVSVQVLCGEESVPTPSSDQRPGDCKVVRYFSGSLEP